MYGVWENLTGKESKTENPGDLRLLEKSFDKGIRKERIFFWKNPMYIVLLQKLTTR